MPAALGTRNLLLQAALDGTPIEQIREAVEGGQGKGALVQIGVLHGDRRLRGQDGQHVPVRTADWALHAGYEQQRGDILAFELYRQHSSPGRLWDA